MSMRVAIVADLASEHWPSMDLVADQLAANLPRVAPEIKVTLLRPAFPSRAARVPLAGASRPGRAVDRYAARYRDYPAWLAAHRDEFDLFHIVDHSYAHVVHSLPPERSVVTCHDIDAFRCLPPLREPASPLYRRIAPRILEGLRRAVRVTCDTEATRAELVAAGFVEAARTSVVPNGVHPAFFQEPDSEAVGEGNRLVGPPGRTELLHVGSTIPRKEIEFLLELFALLRRQDPQLHLVQAGGELTRSQRALAARLGITDSMTIVPPVDARVLSAIYRRASIVLLPSSREGFGLPVVEALACGTPVIASDLPALREVGADAVVYAQAHDIFRWASAVHEIIEERRRRQSAWLERVARGRMRAALFTWTGYAEQMLAVYRQALETTGVAESA